MDVLSDVYELCFNLAVCLDRPVVLPTSGNFITEWFPEKLVCIQTGKACLQKQGTAKPHFEIFEFLVQII